MIEEEPKLTAVLSSSGSGCQLSFAQVGEDDESYYETLLLSTGAREGAGVFAHAILDSEDASKPTSCVGALRTLDGWFGRFRNQ